MKVCTLEGNLLQNGFLLQLEGTKGTIFLQGTQEKTWILSTACPARIIKVLQGRTPWPRRENFMLHLIVSHLILLLLLFSW